MRGIWGRDLKSEREKAAEGESGKPRGPEQLAGELISAATAIMQLGGKHCTVETSYLTPRSASLIWLWSRAPHHLYLNYCFLVVADSMCLTSFRSARPAKKQLISIVYASSCHLDHHHNSKALIHINVLLFAIANLQCPGLGHESHALLMFSGSTSCSLCFLNEICG